MWLRLKNTGYLKSARLGKRTDAQKLWFAESFAYFLSHNHIICTAKATSLGFVTFTHLGLSAVTGPQDGHGRCMPDVGTETLGWQLSSQQSGAVYHWVPQ